MWSATAALGARQVQVSRHLGGGGWYADVCWMVGGGGWWVGWWVAVRWMVGGMLMCAGWYDDVCWVACRQVYAESQLLVVQVTAIIVGHYLSGAFT